MTAAVFAVEGPVTAHQLEKNMSVWAFSLDPYTWLAIGMRAPFRQAQMIAVGKCRRNTRFCRDIHTCSKVADESMGPSVGSQGSNIVNCRRAPCRSTAVRLKVEENQLVGVFGEIGLRVDGLKGA